MPDQTEIRGSRNRRRRRRGAAAEPEVIADAAPVPQPAPADAPAPVEAAAQPAAASPAGGPNWLARLDELAASLAAATSRTMILDRAAREAMTLLPADTAVVRSDGPTAEQATFDEPEGERATATIPLAIGGASFGTLTVTAKPGHRFGATERQLLLAM